MSNLTLLIWYFLSRKNLALVTRSFSLKFLFKNANHANIEHANPNQSPKSYINRVCVFVWFCKFLMLVDRIWQTSLAWRQVRTIPFKINLPLCISPKQVNCEWNLHVYVSDWEGCKDTHVPCNDRHCMSKMKIFFSIKDIVNSGMSLILCVVCTLSLHE